ncbi:hypothetical protein K0M31_015917, partial [Melipona bicolor]
NTYFHIPVNLTGARRDRYIRNARKPSVKTALEHTCHGRSAIVAQSPVPGPAIDGPLVCP